MAKVPLSETRAAKWLEEQLGGTVDWDRPVEVPDGEFPLVSLRVRADLFDRLEAKARSSSMNVPTYVRTLIEQAVDATD